MDIGYAIQNLLDNNNMTQKELARQLGMAAPTLNGYIKNNHQPDYQTLIDIAKFFNVTVDYLLHYTAGTKPAETRLIENFRSLDRSQQEVVSAMAELMEKQNRAKRIQKNLKNNNPK